MVRYLICNIEGRSSIFSIIHHTSTSTEGHSKKEASACITLVLGNCLQVTARLGLLSKGRPCDIQSQTSRELLPGCTVYIVADGKKEHYKSSTGAEEKVASLLPSEGGLPPTIEGRSPPEEKLASFLPSEGGLPPTINVRSPPGERFPSCSCNVVSVISRSGSGWFRIINLTYGTSHKRAS